MLSEFSKLTDGELDNELFNQFAENRLTELFYKSAIKELIRRNVHPEVLATLKTVGEPEWRNTLYD